MQSLQLARTRQGDGHGDAVVVHGRPLLSVEQDCSPPHHTHPFVAAAAVQLAHDDALVCPAENAADDRPAPVPSPSVSRGPLTMSTATTLTVLEKQVRPRAHDASSGADGSVPGATVRHVALAGHQTQLLVA
jgi:hypothetical protein